MVRWWWRWGWGNGLLAAHLSQAPSGRTPAQPDVRSVVTELHLGRMGSRTGSCHLVQGQNAHHILRETAYITQMTYMVKLKQYLLIWKDLLI